jgi:hypothetical protein
MQFVDFPSDEWNCDADANGVREKRWINRQNKDKERQYKTTKQRTKVKVNRKSSGNTKTN